jgi:hypothetical protein
VDIPKQFMTALPSRNLRPGGAGELVVVLLLACVVAASIPLAHGGISISWDALNHQVYLGWTAGTPRFDLDVLAASWQTYQYPYLYWPLYKLAANGFSGVQAGIALALLQVMHIPPLWMVTRKCIPDADWFGAAMRLVSVAIAFAGGLMLSLMDGTSNDMLAAVPLVWALSIAFLYAAPSVPARHARAGLCASAILAGVSVAFKFSNGPLALLMPVLWALAPGSARHRMGNVTLGCALLLASFSLAYAPWGAQLWRWHGNPFYPMAEAWFGGVRAAVGWAP